MRGPQPETLVLRQEHLEILQKNLRTGTTEYRVARRSQLLLLRGQGMRPTEIAERLGCGRNTVWRLAKRYREKGLGALEDLPRPGYRPKFSPSAKGADHSLGLS